MTHLFKKLFRNVIKGSVVFVGSGIIGAVLMYTMWLMPLAYAAFWGFVAVLYIGYLVYEVREWRHGCCTRYWS